jgi:hypothetical protein
VPLTETNVKIAACEIALDKNHRDDYSRLGELQERFPSDDPADMAALEFMLMWAVKIYEDPALGEPAVRRCLEHHRNAQRIRSSWRRNS